MTDEGAAECRAIGRDGPLAHALGGRSRSERDLRSRQRGRGRRNLSVHRRGRQRFNRLHLQVGLGGKHDLVDREPVFTRLDADRLRAGGRKVNRRAEHVAPVPVVLPHPVGQSAARAVLEVHFGARGGADPIRGGPRGRHAAGELHEDGIVSPIVAVGAPVEPEAIRLARLGVELHLEVVRRVRHRGPDLRRTLVGMLDDGPAGSCRVEIELSISRRASSPFRPEAQCHLGRSAQTLCPRTRGSQLLSREGRGWRSATRRTGSGVR